MAYADTNLFVALFAGPDHPLHDAALGLFRRVADGRLGLIVTSIVVAELVYVTRSILAWTRASAVERLSSLLDADGLVVPERRVLLRALAVYADRPKLDFADAYLAALAAEMGPPVVASFDKEFDAVDGIRRISA